MPRQATVGAARHPVARAVAIFAELCDEDFGLGNDDARVLENYFRLFNHNFAAFNEITRTWEGGAFFARPIGRRLHESRLSLQPAPSDACVRLATGFGLD